MFRELSNLFSSSIEVNNSKKFSCLSLVVSLKFNVKLIVTMVNFVLQTKGPLPQGATIVKLVTTQSGGTGKPTAIITTSQPGQTPSTILGISSVQPQVWVHFKSIAVIPLSFVLQTCFTLYEVFYTQRTFGNSRDELQDNINRSLKGFNYLIYLLNYHKSL